MNITLPEMMKFSLCCCNRLRSCLACNALLFALVLSALPVTSGASTAPQLHEAINLLEQKQYSRALDLLQNIEKRIPDPGQVAPLHAAGYLGLGYQLLSAGEFNAAREAFLRGRQYNEDDIRFWQGEAMTCFKQGQYAEAVSILNQALGIAPQSPDLYRLLGQAYYAGGRMAEALDAFKKSNEFGGGADVAELLEKVELEWQIEKEMEREVDGHFHLSFVDGELAASLAPAILEKLADAYTELGSDLAYYPDVRVPVLLYSHSDFSAVTHSPNWAGAVYDGKIRLPLGGLHLMTEQFSAVLYHEYMHVLVHFLANRHAPVWLNEGLAELAGRQVYSTPLSHLKVALEENTLIEWEDLVGPFTGLDKTRVMLAYEQSYSLVSFMVDRFGWHKMSELLEVLGKRQAWRPAIAAVYADYGLDWPALLIEWQASQN